MRHARQTCREKYRKKKHTFKDPHIEPVVAANPKPQ
jgi:hypothetical protein